MATERGATHVRGGTPGRHGKSSTLTWPSIERYFPRSKPENHILTLPAYSLVYVKNPKVASSTVVVWLDRLHTRRPRFRSAPWMGRIRFGGWTHSRPQHVNLLHPLISYQPFGKLENFTDDLERIREEARLPDIPVVSRNVSPRKRPDSVYDGRPDLVRRVEQLYAEDFELYGY